MEGAGFVELHFLAGARFCDQRARKRTANTVTISIEKVPLVSIGDWSREGAYVENPKQQSQTYCPAAAWSNGTRSSLPMCGVFRLSGLDGIFLSRENVAKYSVQVTAREVVITQGPCHWALIWPRI